MDINSLVEKLNPEFILELMKLGATIAIPCNEGLELDYGQIGFRGLIDSDKIVLELGGEPSRYGSIGSKYYFPLSIEGIYQAIAFAESEVKSYLNIE